MDSAIPPVVWRLTKARYIGTDPSAARGALSGYGSLLRGGRWHPKGYPVVYTAESAALALLETLVHAERADLLRFDYAAIPIGLTEAGQSDLARVLRSDELPEDWRAWPAPRSTQQIGADWFDAGEAVALVVPSAVVPHERNVLLNPRHPRFGALDIGEPEPFPIDERLAL